MGRPTLKQSWMPLLLATMTFATAYLGNDVYQTSQEPTSVTVNVESMPNVSHVHRSTENIQAMIDKSVKVRMHLHITAENRH